MSDGGLSLAVLSNIWRPYLASACEHLGVLTDGQIPEELQQFSFVTGRAKPDPDAFAAVLRAAGASADEAVMVGDRYDLDVHGAAAMGLRTVRVLARPQKEVRDLVRVLNGAAPAPDRAVASIADVTPETIHGLWRST